MDPLGMLPQRRRMHDLPLLSREWKNGSNTADGQNPA